MFTTDPIYKKPLIPRITIKSLDGGTTYYTYDPWTDSGTTTKAIGCNVQLSQNHQGIFTVQIEDGSLNISSSVNLGARVLIECGKQSTQMTRLISGLIRQKGYSRGADGKVILTLSGSSTAIRLNEKILYYVNEAAKLADGFTIDINDVTRKADLVLQTGLAGLTSEAIINAGGVVASSDVENFIASVAIEYGEAQDLCNVIEEQTNGEVFVDVNDVVQLRHQLQPPVSGKGFTIKNKFATNDNADDTCYLRGRNWDYTESCLKSDGYSSRIYGILPSESPSSKEDFTINQSVAFADNTNGQETAVKFRPTHSHWTTGDIFVMCKLNGDPSTQIPVTTRFRVITDAGGVPTNVGGVVANIDFAPETFQEVQGSIINDPAWTYTNQETFFNTSNVIIDSFDLDTTKDYWFLHSDDNTTISTPSCLWAAQATATVTRAVHTTNQSTNTAGGSSYTVVNGAPAPIWDIPRRRSQPFEASDPKAISAIAGNIDSNKGMIESTLSNTPSILKTREAMYRYLCTQLYYMARPRINWNMATVTAPNVPIVPGDPIMISDSVMGFSAPGQQATMATCGDMTYSWQLGQYQAPTILSIQPVSNPTFYR
jgi:hypothetical protein